MQKKEIDPAERTPFKSEVLSPEFAEDLRRKGHENWSTGIDPERARRSAASWMKKLAAGDYSGPKLDESRYLSLRNEQVKGNPRQTAEYRKLCLEAVGVRKKYDEERYAHLKADDIPPIRWVVERGSG